MAEQQKPVGDADAIVASKIKPERVRWRFEDRIPVGMLSVVAGPPDQGKGLFAAHVAAHVSRNRHENVIYSAAEDGDAVMTRPRLEAAGADLDRIMLWPFYLPDQLGELNARVERDGVGLVVLDPFNAHLIGPSRYADSIRKVLTPLKKMAERTGCSVLVIEHTIQRLPAKAHPLTAIGGSGSGLKAAARMAYLFGSDPKDGDRRILAAVKSNLRQSPDALAFETDSREVEVAGEVPFLLNAGEVEFDPRRLLQGDGKAKGPAPTKRAAAAEWLTLYLAAAGKPVKVGLAIEDGGQNGHSRKTLLRAAGPADVDVLKDPPKGGKNCTWELPDGHPMKQVKGGGANV